MLDIPTGGNVHKHLLCSLAILLAFTNRAIAHAEQPPPQDAPRGAAKPSALKVETKLVDLRDEKRDRTIPVKFYIPVFAEQQSPGGPATIRAPMPLVLLSHGLGGTREVGAYLANCWAERGYVVCAIQHPGSDDSVWRDLPLAERMDGLRRAVANPTNAIARPADVSFVIDTLLAEHERGQGVGAMINPDQIAAAGHSFGAYTVLAVAGQRFGPLARSRGDERVKVVIAMSPQPPAIEASRAYADVKIPILHLTGTHDTSPLDPQGMKPEDRQLAFRGIAAPDQYLVVFEGADHMVFSGVVGVGIGARRQRDQELDKTVMSLVQQSTTLFLDAFLKGDAASQTNLRGGGLKEMIGDAGKVETK